jgi:DNA-binding FadR family transcriptional regulator
MYYNEDTERAVQEKQRAISRALKTGDTKRARLLMEQLREFIKERGT